MATKELLSKYSVPQLHAIIKKTNVKGFTKLNKTEIIEEMKKPEHISNFSLVGELSSFTLPSLKKELKRTNMTKWNKLTKGDLIDKMLLPEHISNFDDIEPKETPKKRGQGKKQLVEEEKKMDELWKKIAAEKEADKKRYAKYPSQYYTDNNQFPPESITIINKWYKKNNILLVKEFDDDEFEADVDGFRQAIIKMYSSDGPNPLPEGIFGIGDLSKRFTMILNRQMNNAVSKIMDDDFDYNDKNIKELLNQEFIWGPKEIKDALGRNTILPDLPKVEAKPKEEPKPKVEAKPKKEIKKTTFTPKLIGEILRWYRDTNAKFVEEIMDEDFEADEESFEEKAQELYGNIESSITLTESQLDIVDKKIQKQIKKVVKDIMNDEFAADEDQFEELFNRVFVWE